MIKSVVKKIYPKNIIDISEDDKDYNRNYFGLFNCKSH